MTTLLAAVAVATVTTVAGMPGVPGFRDGIADDALFNKPTALTLDRATGDVYVIDRINQRVRRIGPDGMVSTLPSPAEGFNFDGPAGGGIAQFAKGGDIFPGEYSGSIFVSDTGHQVIDRISAFSGYGIRTEAGVLDQSGFKDGLYLGALFSAPTQLVLVGKEGTAYVCDTGNHVVRQMNRLIGFVGDDGYIVSTLAGTPGLPGSADGLGNNSLFNAPRGIAIGLDGTLYVADTGNHTIRMITVQPFGPAGQPPANVQTIAGRSGVAGSIDGASRDALFNSPMGVAVDDSGRIYVADTGNCVVREIVPFGNVSTIAGVPGVCSFANGDGDHALLNGPVGIVAAGPGILYVADTSNHIVRKIVIESAAPRRRPSKK